MASILALDQGTSTSRAILFDSTGSVLALAQKEIKQHYSKSAWVEQDPKEIWNTQLEVAREVVNREDISKQKIAR